MRFHPAEAASGSEPLDPLLPVPVTFDGVHALSERAGSSSLVPRHDPKDIWALYAERLRADLGFLEDPADRLGMLDERMRATRVVLDIGVHLGKPCRCGRTRSRRTATRPGPRSAGGCGSSTSAWPTATRRLLTSRHTGPNSKPRAPSCSPRTSPTPSTYHPEFEPPSGPSVTVTTTLAGDSPNAPHRPRVQV